MTIRLIAGLPSYLGVMTLKRVLLYLFIAFGIFFLIESPAEAAKLVQSLGENAGEWFNTAAHSLGKFLKSLV